VRHVIRAGQHEMVDESEDQRTSHCDGDQPAADSLGWPCDRKTDQRSRQDDDVDEEVSGPRQGHMRLSMRRAVNERDGQMRENGCGQPLPGRATISAHAQKTSEGAET